MGTFIGLIIILVIWGACKWSTEQKVQIKNPLDVDNSKIMKDVVSGFSKSKINRRYGNGYYDKNNRVFP